MKQRAMRGKEKWIEREEREGRESEGCMKKIDERKSKVQGRQELACFTPMANLI